MGGSWSPAPPACLYLLHTPGAGGGWGGRPGSLAVETAPGLPALPLAGFGQGVALRVSLCPFPTPPSRPGPVTASCLSPAGAPVLRALGV